MVLLALLFALILLLLLLLLAIGLILLLVLLVLLLLLALLVVALTLLVLLSHVDLQSGESRLASGQFAALGTLQDRCQPALVGAAWLEYSPCSGKLWQQLKFWRVSPQCAAMHQ